MKDLLYSIPQVIFPTGTVLKVTEGWDGYHLGVVLYLSTADKGMSEGTVVILKIQD